MDCYRRGTSSWFEVCDAQNEYGLANSQVRMCLIRRDHQSTASRLIRQMSLRIGGRDEPAAHPLTIDARTSIRGRMRGPAAIFAGSSIVRKSDGARIQPFMIFRMSVAEIKVGRSHVKCRWRVLPLRIAETRCLGSRILHAPRTDILSAHVRAFHPNKTIGGMLDLVELFQPAATLAVQSDCSGKAI